LENDELLEALLPTLRADFRVCETYQYGNEPPLDVPIVACGGAADGRANFEDLDAWRLHSMRDFALRILAGDHFFLQSRRDELLDFLSATLTGPIELPARLALADRVVHVWSVNLDENLDKVCRLERLLAAEERRRAERFQFRSDRERFIVGRGVLRILLGLYLRRDPSAVQLWYNSQGKPGLQRNSDDPDLHFNVAHSGGTAIIAVTAGCAIGVDVERVRTDVEWLELAQRYFSSEEAAAFDMLPAQQRLPAFFATWTRKEAYLKAHGMGLALPLDQFAVSVDSREPARLISAAHDPGQLHRWELYSFQPAPGYAAALAVDARGVQFEHARFTDVD
jgi:4'-phosphopantetheinyl transferase